MILDSRLQESSVWVGDLELCTVRLSLNAAFPWVLLIPKREGVVEIIDLTAQDQQLLFQEISNMSQVMKKLFQAEKLNIAALGNVVPQLHVHVIARYTSDKAWPNPVWNSGVVKDYLQSELDNCVAELQNAISCL